jgi:glutamate racemase
MGCTHYPILERVIRKTVGKDVAVINTGRETAKDVVRTLEEKGILNESGRGGSEYFVTDSPDTFKEMGSRFLGEDMGRIRFLKSLDYKDFLLSS